jgi:hypothetical protein
MTTTRKRTLIATALIWLALVAVIIYFPSAAVMQGPRDDRESYVYSWRFQLWARATVDGPPLIGILAVALALEWATFERFARRRDRVDQSP